MERRDEPGRAGRAERDEPGERTNPVPVYPAREAWRLYLAYEDARAEIADRVAAQERGDSERLRGLVWIVDWMEQRLNAYFAAQDSPIRLP